MKSTPLPASETAPSLTLKWPAISAVTARSGRFSHFCFYSGRLVRIWPVFAKYSTPGRIPQGSVYREGAFSPIMTVHSIFVFFSLSVCAAWYRIVRHMRDLTNIRAQLYRRTLPGWVTPTTTLTLIRPDPIPSDQTGEHP